MWKSIEHERLKLNSKLFQLKVKRKQTTSPCPSTFEVVCLESYQMPKETDLEEKLLLQNKMISTENILTSNIYSYKYHTQISKLI